MHRLVLGFCALVALVGSPALAQPFPHAGKTIRLVVPYAPGSVSDIVGRLISNSLKGSMGVPVIVENRPGAGGQIGADFVAKAEADGHTLLVTSSAVQSVSPWLMKNLPYDPINDFAAVVQFVELPQLLVINPAIPAKSVEEFVAQAKAATKKFAFGYAVPTDQAAALAFAGQAKLDVVGVPYKGKPDVLLACQQGEIQFVISDIANALPFMNSGKLRALAVSGANSLVPGLPVLTEIGYPDFNMTIWVGLVAPAKTPPDARTQLAEAITKVLAEPRSKDVLTSLGMTIVTKEPGTFEQFIKEQHRVWGERIRNAGLKPQ